MTIEFECQEDGWYQIFEGEKFYMKKGESKCIKIPRKHIFFSEE